MKEKIGIISLGCAKNLVNTEQMMYLLDEAGYEVTGDVDSVDAVIVNTCGFIEASKMEAIETIIELGYKKRDGHIRKLIVTGCLAERYKDEMLLEMPEIDTIVGVGSFDEIAEAVRKTMQTEHKNTYYGDVNANLSETKRLISTSPVWAYLKIAEGCDNHCAYCVIPAIRGKFRSRSIEHIMLEARELVESGIRELIIIAQDVSRYGLDLYGKRMLAKLLEELCKLDSIKWIRLHYLYPDEIDKELVDVIANNDIIAKYLDIPFQHVNDRILSNMGRRSSGSEIKSLLRYIRRRIPNAVIRTSIIAGLPGEGEAEFDELARFLQSAKIERVGVFVYSPEEGTVAAMMDRPDREVAEHRANALIDLQSLVMDEFNSTRIGSITTVLIEGINNGVYYGRSYAESPDVDGCINVTGENIAVNDFVDVKITAAIDGELYAEKIDNR